MKSYYAIFRIVDRGIFKVYCIGLYGRRNQYCLFPTVEEARRELAENAEYLYFEEV